MRVEAVETNSRATFSDAARKRILSCRGEPLFIAGWRRALMIHFEVDANELQHDVPFELDMFDGRAFVSLVAFTMCGMRPRLGGKITKLLFRPIATHDFLNVRTYVRHSAETGIHFLAEWLSSSLAAKLGPRTFGLPYRHGPIFYGPEWQQKQLRGRVEDSQSKYAFEYRADLEIGDSFARCESGSLNEWLMERYTAFNCARGRKKFFRVWHPPWSQCAATVNIAENSLLLNNWCFFKNAALIGANFSSGFDEVWMGRPHTIGNSSPR